MQTGTLSPVQRGFFKNSAGDLLPTLAFWAGYVTFIIKFPLITIVCRRAIYFIDLKIIEYYQKESGWNRKSKNPKNYVTNYTR